LVAETEERAELQAQRYEERLTELHSVIAELSRKIDRQRALVIREEDDVSGKCFHFHVLCYVIY
jgi:hypothetical protein